MASLDVNFGGLYLKNPIIIASAPPTETIESIIHCAEAGAAAVVTKTIANFDDQKYPLGARRTYVDKKGIWALSTFRRETLTLEVGAKLISGSVRNTDIPIIASVGGLDMNPASWLATCLAVQDAGAKMIQLDLFYLPHPRCSPESIEKLLYLIKYLASHLEVPIAPKLNIELPAYYAAEILAGLPIAATFLIDSIRVPVPLDLMHGAKPLTHFVENAGECSLFGAWQKPITLQYTRTIAERLAVPICAGGGLMTGQDAVEAIMYGATTVQYATAIIQRGYRWIGNMLERIEKYLDKFGYSDINQIRGLALQQQELDETKIVFENVKATVNHELCIMCGLCTTQVFCQDIHVTNLKIEVLPHCDGCGLCISVCPTAPKALSLRSVSEDTYWRE